MANPGYVVFCVRDLESSLKFCREVVSLDVQGWIFNDRAALLSGGHTNQQLLLIQVGEARGPSPR